MIRRIALFCIVLAIPAFGQTTLNGAGATFPNPMYQKWFSEYHKAHPDIEFNYQSIGSGGGIRQVLAQTVDFGASDGPMTDEQLAQAKIQDPAYPNRAGCGGSGLQRSRGYRRTEVYARGAGGNFPGQDHHLERSGDCQGESRGEAARPRTSSSSIVRMAAAPPTSSPTISPRSVRIGRADRARELR